MRHLAKGLAALLAIILMLVTAMVGMNAFDIEPEPDAKRLLLITEAIETSVPSPRDNGYLWTLGLKAPADTDPVGWAAQYLEQLEQVAVLRKARRSDARVYDEMIAAEEKLKPFEKKHPISGKPWCRPESGACLPDFRKQRKTLEEHENRHQLLWQRAQHIKATAHFRDIHWLIDIDAPSPDLLPLLDAQQAAFAMAFELAESGKPQQALSVLETDLLIQRRVLADSDGLLPKIVGNVAVARNLLVAHELIGRAAAPSAASAAYLRIAATPLASNELSRSRLWIAKPCSACFFLAAGRLVYQVLEQKIGGVEKS